MGTKITILTTNPIEQMDIECPFLREIAFSGYNEVIEDDILHEVKLIRPDNSFVKFCMSEIKRVALNCRIITAYIHHKGKYRWISDGDGSADRFRAFITSEPS